jgi:outer membrane lipoprotein-sorting protein
MVISQPNRTDTKEMLLYGIGQEKSYIIFSSPARDKNTAMLRLGDNMWLYLPSAEKSVKISGHMLRQSFMGSDFSYGDTTERLKLLEKYDATLTGTEKAGDDDAFVLRLKAKKEDAAYYERKLWVDRQRYIVIKQEMYAKSGKLLKVMTVSENEKIGSRYYPTKIRMEDKLKKNTYSEMIFSNIRLDETIPESVFTFKNLEKKN